MDSAGKRPRRLRAKYTPRTNLAICTRGISLLRRACVSVLALTDRGAAGNRPALSGVVPPLLRRDNIRGDERRKNGGERWHGTALSRCRSCPMSREEYRICALPGFVDSKNEEKTERNAGYLVVSHSGGGMLRQGTRKGIRRTPANRGMRAHRIVKSLDISEDVCHGLCP